jgi:indolepyruvate ferredoxin oxidoreductase
MKQVSLTDRYDLTQTRIFATGAQAIVRLAMMQHERDRRAGLNTAGYITGYRGSPLGGLDAQLAGARDFLESHSVVFQPGLNEDLAATALWGSQQAELRGEGLYDGVFGIWYGKGPGVDRSGDVFRHANHAGSSKNGGVIALMGDDHTCESSTSAHQSEFAFVDAMMPVLNPAGVQEVLDYGLYGFALSRYAGVWAGVKCVKDNVEQTASIDGSLDRVKIVTPDDFAMPEGGLNIRLGDTPLEKEARLHRYKRPAVLAFARANGLDRTIWSGGRAPRIGVVTAGKSYLDTAEALNLLGLDEAAAERLGLRLYKVAMTWPLEPTGIARFAQGLDLVIVVEEKRSLIETQIKEQLYGTANAPVVIGKKDEKGANLFQPEGALEPVQIALAVGEHLSARTGDEALKAKLEELARARPRASDSPHLPARVA